MSFGGLSQIPINDGQPPGLPPMAQQHELPADHAHWPAFEAEALPCLGDLFRHARWLAPDRSTAEDLVQETMKQALESFRRYDAGTNCRAWLLKILYHLNSKRRRTLKRQPLVADAEAQLADVPAYEPSTPEGLTEGEVLRALRCLPASFQQVIVLSDVEDFTYREIAALLEVPLGTVMSRLHRARKVLRVELAVFARSRGIGRVHSTIK